jgi:hypothetical protein
MPDLMWRDWQTSPPPKGVRIVDPKFNIAGLTWRPAHDGDPRC